MRQLELVHDAARREGIAWRCSACGWTAAVGRLARMFNHLPAFIDTAFEDHDCGAAEGQLRCQEARASAP